MFPERDAPSLTRGKSGRKDGRGEGLLWEARLRENQQSWLTSQMVGERESGGLKLSPERVTSGEAGCTGRGRGGQNVAGTQVWCWFGTGGEAEG